MAIKMINYTDKLLKDVDENIKDCKSRLHYFACAYKFAKEKKRYHERNDSMDEDTALRKYMENETKYKKLLRIRKAILKEGDIYVYFD